MKATRIIVSLLGVILLAVLYNQTFPLFDKNSTTLICSSRASQIAAARALSRVIGEPLMTLDTPELYRFIFKDGTSIDALVHPSETELMYNVVALKQISLGLLSFSSPMDLAMTMKQSWENDGCKVQVISQPDKASPEGNIVLVLSDALRNEQGSGSAIIIRKHVFRIGGQRPQVFIGWPKN